MSGAAGYILRVTAGAVIAAVLSSLAGNTITGKLIRTLAGIFMALTVIAPVTEIEIPDLGQWFHSFDAAAQAAAAEGQEMADESRGQIIIERLETYILDIADACGASVKVEVTLDQKQQPCMVMLTGNAASDAGKELTRIITENLGLKEGAVVWIETD